MSYLELAKKIQAGLKPTPPAAAPETVKADPLDGNLIAVKIASTVLDADIWLAFTADFKPDEGEPLAVFFPDELEFLATKDASTLKEIHKVKLAFPGSRVRQ